MPDINVGVLGASSLVGGCVLSKLADAGYRAVAFSRATLDPAQSREKLGSGALDNVEAVDSGFRRNDGENESSIFGVNRADAEGGAAQWIKLADAAGKMSGGALDIALWICAAPIWVLPGHFQLLESCGVRKVVALSSTSRFSKDDSSDIAEQQLAKRLADAELQVQAWAQQRGIEWVILRPTLIYGLGRDKNITEMVRLIQRFGFFPLFGKAHGLRQPIHADDVAAACVAALQAPAAANRAFNISGAETLGYREMMVRVFTALGRRPRLLNVPLWAFRLAVVLLRVLPRYRHWSAAMAERMNRDLVFDHADAAQAFGFKPGGFALTQGDLP